MFVKVEDYLSQQTVINHKSIIKLRHMFIKITFLQHFIFKMKKHEQNKVPNLSLMRRYHSFICNRNKYTVYIYISAYCDVISRIIFN